MHIFYMFLYYPLYIPSIPFIRQHPSSVTCLKKGDDGVAWVANFVRHGSQAPGPIRGLIGNLYNIFRGMP